jgi:hypothetical protein
MVREIYVKATNTARPASHGSIQKTRRSSSSVRRANVPTCSTSGNRHIAVFRTCVLLQRWKRKRQAKSGARSRSAASAEAQCVNATSDSFKKEPQLQKPLLDHSTSTGTRPFNDQENGYKRVTSDSDIDNNNNNSVVNRGCVSSETPKNYNQKSQASNGQCDIDTSDTTEPAKENSLSANNAPAGPVTRVHLQSSSVATSRKSIMVSIRAASFLLPLYGLHYLVFAYRLDTT